jgi:predicted CoA-binding protein
MPSEKEEFFQLKSFAVVGNTDFRPFPKITYRNLRKLDKRVFPVELGGARYVEGDEAFPTVADLPERVDGVIVELPRHKVMPVVKDVAEEGIKNLWLHMGCDSPEVLEFCKEKGIHVRYGACAVMYTHQGFSFHSIHRFLAKLFGKY